MGTTPTPDTAVQPPEGSALERDIANPLSSQPPEGGEGPEDTTLTPAAGETPGQPPSETPPETSEPADQPAAGEEAAQAEGEGDGEETTASGYEQLLPWEQAAEYPDALFTLAANKFGVDTALLEDADRSAGIKSLIKGKIDADIHLRNLKYEQELASAGEEEDETKPPVEAPPAPEEVSKTFDAALQFATESVTEEGSKLYLDRIGQAQQKLQQAHTSKDPKAIAAASKEATSIQMGMLTMALTNLLPRMLPAYFGNIQEEQSRFEDTYTQARETLKKDPKYGQFVEPLHNEGKFKKFLKDFPEFTSTRFKGPDGNPLNDVQNAMQQYQYAIRFIRGEAVESPADLVNKGMKAGQKARASADANNKRGQLGKGGRSTGTIQGGDGDSAFMDRMIAADKRSNPMDTLLRKSEA